MKELKSNRMQWRCLQVTPAFFSVAFADKQCPGRVQQGVTGGFGRSHPAASSRRSIWLRRYRPSVGEMICQLLAQALF